MADILKENIEEIENVTEWVASEFRYLKEMKEGLEGLKKNIEDPKKEKALAKGLSKSFRYAGRSERRIIRYFNRLLKKMEGLKEIIPPDQKSQLEKLETNMDVAAKKILKEASLFVGKIKEDINDLRVQIDLLIKKPGDEKIIKNINDLIADLNGRIEETTKWTASLSASLENTKNFIIGLQRMAA